MHNTKKGEKIGIIITIVILILLVMISNNKLKDMSFFEKSLNAIVMPIQNGYTYLKNKISGNNSFFENIDKLSEENTQLKQINSELEIKLRELEIIKAENQTLKEYLDLTEKYKEYTTVPAYIINKDISNFSNTFVVNVGEKDGIEENMTVIADKGLVGHVISVSNNTSKVKTILDSSSAVSINFSSTGDKAICKGKLSYDELKVNFISNEATILENDTIETSGMGGIYPKGILIGNVKNIIETKNSTDRYATVIPAVNFENLETVLIIKK